MPTISYRNRRAVEIENQHLRVTVLEGGGHIAEIQHKPTGVNPLWTPPWPSMEPSAYDPGLHPQYGNDSESKLLAGIMGHNLCLDTFGGRSGGGDYGPRRGTGGAPPDRGIGRRVDN